MIERVIVITADLADMVATVGIDDPEVVFPAANQHENALTFTVLDELDAVAK